VGGGNKMARLVGIDITGDILTVTLQYSADLEEETVKFAKENLGKNIDITDLNGLCPELE